MAFAHPALNTIGSRKKKQKFASAEAKRQFMALEASWTSKQEEWRKMSKPVKVKVETTKSLSPSIPDNRKSACIPSRNTGDGIAALKESPKYTGEKIIGISTLHKSCLQPVFSKEEAINVAKMRR